MIPKNSNKQNPWKVIQVNYSTWEESEEILIKAIERILEAPTNQCPINA